MIDVPSYLLGRKSSGGAGVSYVVVEELPSVGENGIIYLVPKEDAETDNVYNEYMWIENDWELIGDTQADLSDYQKIIQYSTIPTASADNLGKIIQYIGTTTNDYTNGYFYECVSDGQNPATYSWSNINVQTQPDLSNYLAKDNTTAFTPTGDYNPATKKYVDDNAGSIYTIAFSKINTDSTDLRNVCQKIINDYYAGKLSYLFVIDNAWFNTADYGAGSIVDSNGMVTGLYCLQPTTWNDTGEFYLANAGTVDWQIDSSSYSLAVAKRYTIFLRTNTTTHEITFVSFSATIQKPYNKTYFLATNKNYNTPYTPQYDGSPATKKYVDDNTGPSVITSSDSTYTIDSLTGNKTYKLSEITALTITATTTFDRETVIYFESGTTATAISIPATITNIGDNPTFTETGGVNSGTCTASKNYIISILNNIAVWKEY